MHGTFGYHAWYFTFGNLPHVPRTDQKQFVQLVVDAHCDKASSEAVQHIYSTLAILQQALYCIVDENAAKLGTWKYKGSEINSDDPNSWTLQDAS